MMVINTKEAIKVCPHCKEFDGNFCKRNHLRIEKLMIVDRCQQFNK